jgi:hypothetical protein
MLQRSRWTCTGATSMSDFGPALGLYILTAAVSITLTLSWIV